MQPGWGAGNGGGEVLGVLVNLAGSTSLRISGHSGRESGTSGGLMSSPRRMASFSNVEVAPCFSSVGFKREATTMSSLLRVIKGATHFQSSHAKSRRTPFSIPDLSVQVCSAQAKARVFCLMVQKSLVSGALV